MCSSGTKCRYCYRGSYEASCVSGVCALKFIFFKFDKHDRIVFFSIEEKKNSLCPPKDLLLGSLATSEYPHGVTISAVKQKRREMIKMAVIR